MLVETKFIFRNKNETALSSYVKPTLIQFKTWNRPKWIKLPFQIEIITNAGNGNGYNYILNYNS